MRHKDTLAHELNDAMSGTPVQCKQTQDSICASTGGMHSCCHGAAQGKTRHPIAKSSAGEGCVVAGGKTAAGDRACITFSTHLLSGEVGACGQQVDSRFVLAVWQVANQVCTQHRKYMVGACTLQLLLQAKRAVVVSPHPTHTHRHTHPLASMQDNCIPQLACMQLAEKRSWPSMHKSLGFEGQLHRDAGSVCCSTLQHSPAGHLLSVTVNMESGGSSSPGVFKSIPLLAKTTCVYKEPLFLTACTGQHTNTQTHEGSASVFTGPIVFVYTQADTRP